MSTPVSKSAPVAAFCTALTPRLSTTTSSLSAAGVGQKAAHLSRLAAAGLPVPPAFALLAAAFEAHLDQGHAEHGTLRAAVASARDEDDEATATRIGALIVDAAVPVDVATDLLAWRRRLPQSAVIVRSSAVGEDGDDASFAGQLDSFSGIDGPGEATGDDDLLLAVKRCWASAFSARALFYQRARQRPLTGVAVVVQSFVNARVSGVLFTVAPGAEERMRAEFCFGPGEALVSGRVTPGAIDAGRASGPAVITSWPEQVEAVHDERFVGADRVVDLGRRIETLFGAPQDIEWCIDDRAGLWVVQSRPITTGPGRSPAPTAPATQATDQATTTAETTTRPVRFSNANVNENFPTPISPFLYSIARKGYAAYFENLGRLMGLDEERIELAGPALSSIVGAHGGRLYYNLSSLHGCLRVAPFGDWLTSSFNVFVGVDGGAAEGSALRPRDMGARALLQESRAALTFVGRATHALATATARLPLFEAEVDDFAVAAHPSGVPHLSDDALEHLLRRFVDIRVHRWGPAALGDVSAMMGYGLVRTWLKRLMPAAAATLENDLLKGLQDVVSGIPTQKLWELAQEKRQGHPHYETHLAWFLESWGFRRSGELMLTVPTFQEDPTPVLSLIEQLANADDHEEGDNPSPDVVTAGHARTREQQTAAVLAQTHPVLRLPLRGLLAFTRNAIGLRERARLKQALLYTRLRPVVLELGTRLAARGEINHRDDIFWLSIDEVLDHLAGVSMFGAFLKETCALRADHHARLSASTPPDSFTIERGHYLSPSPSPSPSSYPSASWTGTGTPAAAGRARGRAAVLRDVQEAARMTRGDILVTKQTDPGWGPVLFLARALVIERGGMLSHGAIIAREFGVPCVVGVKDASQHLAHGSIIDVDGDRGMVFVVGEDPGAGGVA